MGEYAAVALDPRDARAQAQMDALLAREGIARDANLSYSAGIYDEEGRLVATGSLFGNTLRCLAVDGAHRGEGLMAVIVGHLVQAQLERGNTHLFLYTKAESAKLLSTLGFYEIARVGSRLVFMENRRGGFARYVASLAGTLGAPDAPGAALVMNANPFTNGHAYLLRRAAEENARVVVFVLSEDRSLVPYMDRLEMVREAAAAYGNVQVVPSGSYMISSATFPSYFLKDGDTVTRTHAELDATLFVPIARALRLTRRYVGEEPFSRTTALYNEALRGVLPSAGVELVVVPRAVCAGEPISASRVRELIHEGRMEEIRPLVPPTTYDYLNGERGRRAVQAIRAAGNVRHH